MESTFCDSLSFLDRLLVIKAWFAKLYYTNTPFINQSVSISSVVSIPCTGGQNQTLHPHQQK